ncbi:MAG: thioredoxin family protein [Planctomycetota bacterium]
MSVRSVSVLLVLGLVVGCSGPVQGQELEIGAAAPEFSLKGVDGETHSLADYKDKDVLVVIFHCNHCPVATAYQDRMIAIQKEYAQKGVQIVAINANDAEAFPADSFENMKKRAKEKGYNFPYLRDKSQEAAKAYGALVTPHVFLFDDARKLRYRGRIDDNWRDASKVTSKDLRAAIDAVLAGEQVPNPTTEQIGCSIKWKN